MRNPPLEIDERLFKRKNDRIVSGVTVVVLVLALGFYYWMVR